ncbi:class I SAM-dependent methyltransferase [Phenylobacterium sp.]|uniref:class I SAM-dependent methyltransferase n=1 Tax=Phenylobacterium sp. TaxID=1871053 RepID=UPI003566E16E
MASLMNLLRRRPVEAPRVASGGGGAPAWAQALFSTDLAPELQSDSGDVLVWTIEDRASTATITDQFKANAEEYHRRYAASDHFEKLFRQGLLATSLVVAPAPLILDIGSGSGVNSVVPCRRLFPGARIVATDLSGELLAMLANYAVDNGAAAEVVCVKMDAMSEVVSPGSFDLVTGASILHHLENPERGMNAAARALKPGGHAIFFEPFNGWAILRLAFERILAESALRNDPLDPLVDTALRQLALDVATRSEPDAGDPAFKAMDDKWLFSRSRITESARAAGFGVAQFVPHNDHKTLYRDVTAVHIRLATGRGDLTLPPWAIDILDSFDAALTWHAKRELMVEGTIVLTKGR